MLKKLLFIVIVFLTTQSMASHIVGGEMSYVCLGNNTYEFTVNIYRDCIGGNPAALESDNPAFISIFRGNSFYSFDSLYFTEQFIVPPDFKNDCIKNPPPTCLSLLRFKFVRQLPAGNLPYTVVYQRCCRNESINNIINPGVTGATYYCIVPPSICNNSAKYKNFPPQIICVNNPFVYDHSATDSDGDSLSYEFCQALEGGDQNDPKPILIGPLPSLTSVNYRSPFTSLVPMGGNPQLKIDPVTGVITGTPNIQGRFVVNVCCHEWRNGVIINTETREFQFVVTNCSKAVVANTPLFSDEQNTYIVSCKSYNVNFKNTSSGGFEYFWDFGVAGTQSDTSIQVEPTFTYPDTGTYIIKLIVNKGSTCPDSINRIVKVYPEFNTEYKYDGLLCPNSPIQFTDLTTSTFEPINYWSWNFDDGNTSGLQNPVHTYANIGKDFVVTLISGNKYGCRDTAKQVLKVPKVNINAGNDTVIVKNENVQLNGTGAVMYQWTPPTYLNNASSGNPIGFFPDTGRYQYILMGTTAEGCVGYDTLKIIVADGPYITIPNAFTPNGDGNNDVFKILAAGYKKLNSFKIFDRWGKQIFYTTKFNEGWNGKFNNVDCDLGTYFWLITGTDLNDKEKTIKGDVILVR